MFAKCDETAAMNKRRERNLRRRKCNREIRDSMIAGVEKNEEKIDM